MGTTPNLILPYPEPSASVDVPRDVKALALAVDTKLNPVLRSVVPTAAGMASTTITEGNSVSGPTLVTYPVGRFTVGPAVLATCTDPQYSAAAISNGFSSAMVFSTFLFGPLGAQVTPSVCWAAIQPTPLPITAFGVTAGPTSTMVLPDQPVVVICHTSGCTNANIAITANVYDSANPPETVCGVCFQPITDITPA
jgi:hypothetical protein